MKSIQRNSVASGDGPRVFVSAMYHIPLSGRKGGVTKYVRLMPESMKLLAGGRLYLFYEDEWLATLTTALAQEADVEIIPIRKPLAELPVAGIARQIAARAQRPEPLVSAGLLKREKGVAHHRNFLADGNRDAYAGCLSVWLSKISLVNEMCSSHMKSQPASVAWVDIGVSNKSFLRQNWDFSKLEFSPDSIWHYGSPMRYLGKQLPLNASFLIASPELWRSLETRFLEALNGFVNEDYPIDEEVVLGGIVGRGDVPFRKIGDPDEGYFSRYRYLWRRWADHRGR